MSERHPQKATLEDLLRLKRTERPSAEFWESFEQELRAKQLTALVSRRPWWSLSWTRVRAGLVRVVVPSGAAAALALALLSINWMPAPEVAKMPATHMTVATVTAPSAPADSTMVPAAQPATPATVVAEANSAPPTPVAAATNADDAASNRAATVAALDTPWTVSLPGETAPTVTVAPDPLPALDTLPVAILVSDPVPPALNPENVAKAVKAGQVTPLTGQLLAMLRPADMFSRPAFARETRTSESVSPHLNEDLLSNDTASRHIVGIEGSSVSLRF